ncbi:MAG: nucleotidyltransferase [Hamadaea sp.]|uniref:nucleotidyltransferase domain-containing protein n=1 Tax=Hamadaea sp. TaxID=2024425 RepID=UPI0017CCBC44|nr:nucleotidyltransferase domain-containing protein [Hamadaea sp.]NUR71529.1 nucleotidyltransferase [Hamadaea sp.]NUT23664.1 nucleotidyltransferase [Hamadaea sp.]
MTNDAVLREGNAVLLEGIVGSTAYGLAGPQSDVDRLGVFAAPTVAFHGLHPPQESVVEHDPDRTLHEAGKYCRLALSGNPTAIELLWLPDELYEVRTPLGDELIGLRSAFLSASRVRDAFVGYASQQLTRLTSKRRTGNWLDRRAAKHARHMLRLIDQGLALYETGVLPIRLADPARYLDFGLHVEADPSLAGPVLEEARERFAAARTVLPEEPDEAAVERWLLRVRAFYLDGD